MITTFCKISSIVVTTPDTTKTNGIGKAFINCAMALSPLTTFIAILIILCPKFIKDENTLHIDWTFCKSLTIVCKKGESFSTGISATNFCNCSLIPTLGKTESANAKAAAGEFKPCINTQIFLTLSISPISF